MMLPKTVTKDTYTEAEAAQTLGVSIARLHELLDRYVFTEGIPRPSGIEFSGADLLLLAYWDKGSAAPCKVSGGAKVVSIDGHK